MEKELPKDWKWISFGDATNNFDGKRVPLSKDVRSKRKGKYRYYGATEIVDYIDDYLFDGKYLLIGEDGANLVSKSRDLAFIVNGQFWVNNHAHVLQTKDNLILEYLHYYFNSLNLAQFVTGTAQPKLNQGNLNKIPIPLPPLSTQQAIVSKIEELFSELDNGIANLKTAQQQLKTYRQSVLKWAFEGKLTNKKIKEGELPKGWNYVRLGDLVDNPKQDLVDGPFGSNLKSEEYVESGIPVFKIQNIKANVFRDKNMCYVTKEKAEQLKRHSFKAGDLIITKLGEPLGLCCAVPEKYEFGIIVADLMRIRPSKQKVDTTFLRLAINSVIVQNQFKKITKGTTRARVNLTIVRDITIPLGSLQEQQKIVQELESRLSVADKMEESINQSLLQAEALRQSILKKAFEGKLI